RTVAGGGTCAGAPAALCPLGASRLEGPGLAAYPDAQSIKVRAMCNTAFRIAVAVLALAAGSASAQIFSQGIYQLPAEDFTYNWGDLRDKGELTDLKTGGVEEDFRCELEMELRPGSRFGDREMREYERQLSSQLDFIYQSVVLMNQFDYARELKWATLVCKKGAP